MDFTWFAFDCNIWTNPKVAKLASLLGLDIDSTVMKLARIWSWAMLAQSEDGDITYLPDDELAGIARWKKKPSTFIQSLLECGFIDECGGRRSLHDWKKSNGKYPEKLRKDRERKEAKKLDGISAGNKEEIPRKVDGIPADTVTYTNTYTKDTVVVVDSAHARAEEQNDLSRVMTLYMDRISGAPPSPEVIGLLKAYTEDMGADVVCRSINIAVDENARKWSYIQAILQNWTREKVKSLDDVQRLKDQREASRQPSGNHGQNKQRRKTFYELAEEMEKQNDT